MPNAERRDSAIKELEHALKSRERKAKAAPLGVVAATLAVLVLLVGGIWFAATYQSDDSSDDVAQNDAATSEQNIEPAALPSGPSEAYEDTVSCEYVEEGEPSKPVDAPAGEDITTSGTRTVTLTTNSGDVKLELDNSKSPCTTNSFEHLAKEGFYNDTICHRSVKSDSMTILQCGDPTGSGTGGPGYTFADEYPTNGVDADQVEQPVTYPRGTLAMANSGANTNGSQFFLVTQDTQLPPKYNIFGTITDSGLKTLDTILDKAPEGDSKPEEEVKITKATVN
ncbi:MAG TPA: peptidylprolyl isomerase [Candidatus Corynebacterium gallistercoris]|uniref:Peptidyl-prolyl cis-trans isomerase n=1 Tax=Candidatus Corynebacterium gallistercoris TaxID=2838530 RepID=A0A9D1RW14_9CORY|nr:peptidylprolyl isomerase [Candidatus Corynebacterium gallistercoris]